jgi:hypothetical protein
MEDVLKVTVIATGFDKIAAVEGLSLEATQRASRPSQSEAPALRGAQARASEESPVFARRSSAPAHLSEAGLSLPIKSSATFPSQIDTDWDTPAFQRRKAGL